MEPLEYLIFGAVIVGALFMAFNNGANDVANSFASAVGAKAITIEQAVLIAGVMNFLGAVLLGAAVSEKLVLGIVDPNAFPEKHLYLLAMVSVLLAAGGFVLAATLWGLPVSSSHSIVGALVGVGFALQGFAGVKWMQIGFIAGSWVVSPLLALGCSFLLVRFVNIYIVGQEKQEMMSRLRFFLPFLLALTVGILLFALLRGTGLERTIFGEVKVGEDKFEVGELVGYALMFGFVLPYVTISSQLLLRSTTMDMPDDPESVEMVFRRLQVGTSSYVAFAQGANDVANAIAPVFAIYLVLQEGAWPLGKENLEGGAPLWILVLGGAGIAVGIAALGKRVIETLSEKITPLNNVRGFAVDFSTATTVVIASVFGLPVSSTHAATGSIMGTGLESGEGIEFGTLGRIAAAWVMTVPAAATASGLIYFLFAWIYGLTT